MSIGVHRGKDMRLPLGWLSFEPGWAYRAWCRTYRFMGLGSKRWLRTIHDGDQLDVG